MIHAMRVYFHTHLPPSVAHRHTNCFAEDASHIVIGIKHGMSYHVAWAKNQLDGYRIRKAAIDHGSDFEEIVVNPIRRSKPQSEIEKVR